MSDDSMHNSNASATYHEDIYEGIYILHDDNGLAMIVVHLFDYVYIETVAGSGPIVLKLPHSLIHYKHYLCKLHHSAFVCAFYRY